MPIYIPAFLLATGGGIVSPTLSIYVKSFELSYTLTMIVLAVGVIGNIPAGFFVERLGRKASMLLGLSLIGASTLGMGIAQDFVQLIGAQLLGGIGNAFWMLARHAYMTEVIPIAQRGRAIALFGGVNRMGTFAGLFGALFLGTNLRIPFFVYASIVLLNLVLCFFFIPYMPPALSQATGEKVPYLQRLSYVFHEHRRVLATAGLGQVFVQTLRRGRTLIIPLYGDEVVGLTTQEVRWTMTISSAVDMSMFPIAGFMMDRFGRRYATVPGICIFATGMVLMPFTRTFAWLLAVAILMHIGNGIASGTMMTLGADLAPRAGPGFGSGTPKTPLVTKGEFLGLWRLTGDFGGAAGPVVFGNVADMLGLNYAGYALGGLGYLAVGIFLWLVPETLEKE